jgi:hypothetical protein
MKQYLLQLNSIDEVQDWLIENRQTIHLDILEACEKAPKTDKGKVHIQAACINGVSDCVIIEMGSKDEVVLSLNKCLSYYVLTENYEMAIRTRDCLEEWNSL